MWHLLHHFMHMHITDSAHNVQNVQICLCMYVKVQRASRTAARNGSAVAGLPPQQQLNRAAGTQRSSDFGA